MLYVNNIYLFIIYFLHCNKFLEWIPKVQTWKYIIKISVGHFYKYNYILINISYGNKI
jgi:hypothetical protein